MGEKLKERSIETEQLTIKGNIIMWDRMMIQLANISSISTKRLNSKPFPYLSLLLVLVGIILIKISGILAIVLIAAGIAWIVIWNQENQKQQEKTNLIIVMNSGSVYVILFNDQSFLQKVLMVLEKIIMTGGIGDSNVVIDIKDNTFSGNAELFSGLSIEQ